MLNVEYGMLNGVTPTCIVLILDTQYPHVSCVPPSCVSRSCVYPTSYQQFHRPIAGNNYFWGMEISAKLYKVYPPETGEGKNGQWKKQFFVVETADQYPKKSVLRYGTIKCRLGQIAEGTPVKVFFDPESREWQGRWFTSLRAWRLDVDGAGGNGGGGYTQQAESHASSIQPPSSGGASFDDTPGNDDLPF